MSLENQGIMPKEPKQTQARTVDVVDPSYQPSRAELREDLRINATFEETSEDSGPACQGPVCQAAEEALMMRSRPKKNQ